MKLNPVLIAMGLTSMMACSPSGKNAGENSSTGDSVNSAYNQKEVKEIARDTSTEATTHEKELQAGVYFVNLKDGDQVKSPLIIQMGVNGMKVEPAGKVDEGKGHHHLIVDGQFIEKGVMVPSDKTHFHFGKGQTTDTLKLSPGQHTLTLQFANGLHASYGKDWSKTIKVTVIK